MYPSTLYFDYQGPFYLMVGGLGNWAFRGGGVSVVLLFMVLGFRGSGVQGFRFRGAECMSVR